jgi:protein-tyrosine phosphatase
VAGYVDIHAHVLPGIDDGPVDLDGSLQLLRAAAEIGISTIAATPHVRSDFPDVQINELDSRCEAVRAAIERERLAIEVVAGAEVSLAWAIDADDREIRLATYDQRGTDLLVETPSGSVFGLDRMLSDVRGRGIRVTLAHPERSIQFQRDPWPLRDVVHHGVLLQVNAYSLADAPRRSGIRKLAEQLCVEGLAHVVASDGHRAASWRPVTTFARGLEALADLVGAERARWIATEGPRAIVEGREVPDGPEGTIGRRRGWRRWRA